MKARSLWPREHGAYVQLLVPLAVALAIAPSLAGVLLAGGATAAFLAHEPLLVLRGQRGKRAQAELAERAQLHLAVCILAASVLGLAGMSLAPHVLAVATSVGIAAGVVVALSWRDHAHTLGGELAAAAALAGAAAPVGVAGGLSSAVALDLWIMWALAFASTVVAVHVVIDSHKRRATRRRWLLWSALLAGSGAGLAVGGFLAAAPIWAASAGIAIARPPATRLRRIGVLLAIVTTATATWVMAVR
jgi:hypothetical protein